MTPTGVVRHQTVNVLMCKFYIRAVVHVIIELLDNMHGATIKKKKTF